MLERAGSTSEVANDRLGARFHNVCLTVGNRQLIHNINCTFSNSGMTVVMGPNGAGKSLFLRLLSGLLKPTSGYIFGMADEGTDPRPPLSMVFQHPVMLRRSAYANIAFVLRRQGWPASTLADKVNGALRAARLQGQAQSPAYRLSGGEQQRLAMARALVVEPRALLLDEPTASLDPASTDIVETMAIDAARKGTKVVFVTHDIKQAKRIANDILFIHSGRVMAHKPAREFFLEPGSVEAQAYLDGRVPESDYD
ncbi:MAG: ATP-binding cassette domain-containing protein [Hyphomicrobiales bacterium]|nr:ATP-binding cassette domain-containing protein [Hyphomicrobiales bacterium]